MKGYLGIDIGSISTKGVIIDQDNRILAKEYLWTEGGNKKITVEIRSLNSKQLDLGLRLPAVYRQSEYEIRNIITLSLIHI